LKKELEYAYIFMMFNMNDKFIRKFNRMYDFIRLWQSSFGARQETWKPRDFGPNLSEVSLNFFAMRMGASSH